MLVPPLKYYEELAAKKVTKERQILSNNFEEEEIEGTEIELHSTAEAPIDVIEIAGNTKQDGEPSLDNESEVVGVSGDVENSFKNKNQLILEDVAETTYYGVTYSCKNGKISLNGTANQPIFIIIPLKKTIKVSKQFYWSVLTNKILSDEKEVSLWLSNDSGSKLFSKDLWLEDNTNVSLSIIPTEETLISRVQFYIGSGFTFNNIEVETQLEYSESATSIVEGKEQIYSLSLGNMLHGNENARDFFEVNIDEEFYQKTNYKKITSLSLVKNWDKYILDGTDNKFLSKSNSTNNNMFVTGSLLNVKKAVNNNQVVKSYCNYFNGNFSVNNIFLNNKIGYGISNAGTLQFGFGTDSEINTLELANAKLQELNSSGHPLYIVYQLKEPEIENITNKELINQIETFINGAFTYKEKTLITSKLFLKLKYRKNMYYDLESRVKALEANTL